MGLGAALSEFHLNKIELIFQTVSEIERYREWVQ